MLKNLKNILHITIFAAFCFVVLEARALPRIPERGTVVVGSAALTGDLATLDKAISESKNISCAGELCAIPSKKFSLALSGANVGKLQLIFDSIRLPKGIKRTLNGKDQKDQDSDEPLLLRGYARIRHSNDAGEVSWRRIGATVYRSAGGNYLEIFLPKGQRNAKNRRSLPLVAWVDLSSGKLLKQVRILRAPREALSAANCGSEHLKASAVDGVITHSPTIPPVARASNKTVYISTFYDAEWYTLFSTASNSKILSIVNAASAVYEQQFSVNFLVRTQSGFTNIATQPVTSSVSDTALDQFRTYGLSNINLSQTDISTMFSGKGFQGSVIGIAYTGVICSARSYSFSLITYISDATTWIIDAHETGHTFNASHDDSALNIMNTYLGSTLPSAFITKALAEINGQINAYYQSCIGVSSTATPTPVGTVATSTPTPGSGGGGGGQPTATPTVPPNSTPGGSNPGAGNDVPITSKITIGPKLSTTGIVKFKITSSLSNSNCQMIIRGAGTATGVPSGLMIYSGDYTPNTDIDISAQVKAKVLKANNNTKVFFQAELQCAGTTIGRSSAKGIDTSKVLSKKSITKQKYLQMLDKGI